MIVSHAVRGWREARVGVGVDGGEMHTGVIPHKLCATLVDEVTFCVFMNASRAAMPSSPSVSLLRTSSVVSLGTSRSRPARWIPSLGVSSVSRRSTLMSTFLSSEWRASSHPETSITRAGERTWKMGEAAKAELVRR